MKASLPRLLVWFICPLPLFLTCVLCGLPSVPALPAAAAPALLGGLGTLLGALPGLGDTSIALVPQALQPTAPIVMTSTSWSSTYSETLGTATPVPTTSLPSSSSTLASSSTPLPLNGSTPSVASGRATTSNSIYALSPSSSPMSQASAPMSNQHRNLIIILSVVLGVVGILVIGAAILLISRYRTGKAPFGSRGASPINDEEIQSWRYTGHEPKHAHSSSDPRSIITTRDVSIDSIALAQAPRWPPHSTQSNMVHPNLPPSALGRAPNARAGLTDETVPGDVPFVPTAKRQNSRLSKAPPGHARTKSRRSSSSAKSTRSLSGPGRIVTWYDPESGEAKEVGDPISSSPGTSIWEGQSVGGLSPPPRSQLKPWEKENEIGRAIS